MNVERLEAAVPPNTLETLKQYVENGLPPGHFVTAVLENKLSDAVFRADRSNLESLVDIVRYVYNCMPSDCWGSSDRVTAWIKERTRERFAREDAARGEAAAV